MHQTTVLPVISLLCLACAETSPFGWAGGSPRSEAVRQAAQDLLCEESSLLTQVKEDHLVVATAAYAVVGDTWELRLRHKNGGWIFGRELFKEDLDVFEVAVNELECDPHEVWLQREVGVRVARGCGFARGYSVVCGDEVRGFAIDKVPNRRTAAPVAQVAGTDAAARGPTEARPFDPTMTRPERMCGRLPQFNQLSLDRRSQGLLIIRCEISEDGYVEDCSVVKALEYHTEVAVDALYSQRYKPATFNGVPIRVDYVFNVRALLPQ